MAPLYKTRGIVINYLKYGETSLIAKILTEEFGVQSYIVNSVRTRKPRYNISLFQPLTILNLVVYKKKNANLNRISEIEPLTHSPGIQGNIYKSCIALFVSEVLNRTLKEELEDRLLFNFVVEAIKFLEWKETGFNNFHLFFLVKLSRFLGFAPHSGEEIVSQVYQTAGTANPDEIAALDALIGGSFDDEVKMSVALRRKTLEDLVKFYQLHIENFGRLRSMDVLRETLS